MRMGRLYISLESAMSRCTLLVPQVTVNGTRVMFNRSTGNVTGLSLVHGVTYSVSVVECNQGSVHYTTDW